MSIEKPDTFGQQSDYINRLEAERRASSRRWWDNVSPLSIAFLSITIQLAAITIMLGVIVAKMP